MLVSVTRLRIRRFIYLLPFLWSTRRSQAQVVGAPGFLGGRLLVDAHRTFWTLTAWESEKAMKAYRGSGVHSAVMPKLAHWCDEAAVAHWESTDAAIPAWPQASEFLAHQGKPSRVLHPSPAHEALQFPPPRLKPLIGGDLKPKTR
jgi:heme-degrading monooxygenase HmoA